LRESGEKSLLLSGDDSLACETVGGKNKEEPRRRRMSWQIELHETWDG